MFVNELPNNTSQQLPLILVGFGFTTAQTSLLNVVKPLWGMLLILVSAVMLYARLGSRLHLRHLLHPVLLAAL